MLGSKKIISISFLYMGERIRIGVDKNGKFQIPKVKTAAQRLRPKLYPHTAKQFIEHEKVRESDPVLTFDDGSKIRVYLGGDPTSIVAIAASAIDNHDNAHKNKKRISQRANSAKSKSKSSVMTSAKKIYKDSLDDYFDNYGLFGYPYSDDYDDEGK